jgi:hypothetical protein
MAEHAAGCRYAGREQQGAFAVANLRIPALILAAVLGGGIIFGAAGAASAMPVSQLAPAAERITEGAQTARWVCGPHRCWHRHYWGPWGWHRPYWGGWHLPYWGGWGWHHRYWHRWGGWGWHHHHHWWHRHHS